MGTFQKKSGKRHKRRLSPEEKFNKELRDCMYELEPPYPIDEYYRYTDEKLSQLIWFIKEAIRLMSNMDYY